MPGAYGTSTGLSPRAPVAAGNRSGDGCIACAHRAVASRRRALGAQRLTGRLLEGIALAAAVALAARRARALSTSGAIAAAVVGALAVTAGWVWAVVLIAHFIVASGLSRFGAERKARRTASMIAKSGERDAIQVLANGGVFGLTALGFILFPLHPWFTAGAGAIAASAADTWATEIGMLARGSPRTIRTLRRVPPGTSGAISGAGTVAMIVGAAFVALIAYLFHSPGTLVAGIFIGGVAGAIADTALGATVQERRRCLGCGEHTERRIHVCGSRTQRSGGIKGIDNDVVNLLATIVGSAVAVGFVDVAVR